MVSNACRDLVVELLKLGSLCVVHHWDCDGIASAALLGLFAKERGLDIEFRVPPIEVYDESIYNEIATRKSLLVLDYAVYPKFKALVIDHHRVEYEGNAIVCNPVAAGSTEDQYPSTTIVIKRHVLPEAPNDIVALGIVGDLGKSLETSPWKEFVFEAAKSANLDFNEIVKAAELLNMCYTTLSRELVSYARDVLLREGVRGVIRDGKLDEVAKGVLRELDRVLKSVEPCLEDRHLVVYRIAMSYSLVSKVGRELAHRHPDKVVVVVGSVSRKIGRIYIRSASKVLSPLIPKLRSLGVGKSVGGKDRVVSILCNAVDCENELPIVLKVVREIVG